MKTNMRHTDTMSAKAKQHEVEELAGGQFRVYSCSGKTYTVSPMQYGGGYQCTCNWGRYHRRDEECVCSHVMAVVQVIEDRKVSFWSSDADAKRQRRPIRPLGDGVLATLRR